MTHHRYDFRRPFSYIQETGDNQKSACKFAIPHSWNALSDQEKQIEKISHPQKTKIEIDH